ncbi:hypothetical protein [Rhizobium sp. BK251]|uniref:hypothetical protein n=1 Tax=Rhizobium sp. BK251 TaxID=2512125 RepID=UPI001048E6C4|nr:hypothetical protein [Rhizobium sp. BK251]TCL75018.1 hypothetical protein EV286_102583 [Rhizobium sp. BK251]
MTDYDFDESRRRAARDTTENRGEGEHEYFDHLRTLSLSIGERVIVFCVLALIAGVGVAGYMTEPGTSPQTTGSIRMEPVAETPRPTFPGHSRCSDVSPFPGREC